MRRPIAFLLGLSILPGAALADCTEEINKAFAAMYAATPFRNELIAKGNDITLRTVSEVMLPHAIRMTTEGADASEIVMIGDRVWRNAGDGFEELLPAELGKRFADQIRATHGRPLKDIKNSKCDETETRDGRTYKVYQYDQAFMMGQSEGLASGRLLVDKETGLPASMDVNSAAMGMMTMSFMKITYDKSIKIDPPQVKAPAASGTPPAEKTEKK